MTKRYNTRPVILILPPARHMKDLFFVILSRPRSPTREESVFCHSDPTPCPACPVILSLAPCPASFVILSRPPCPTREGSVFCHFDPATCSAYEKSQKTGQKIGDFVNCKPFLDSSRACFSCRVRMTRKVFLVPCHSDPCPLPGLRRI